MTREQIIQKFPHASEAFIQRNLGAAYLAPQLPRAEPEPTVQYVAPKPDAGEERGSNRFAVCITSYRKRLLDADNLAGGCKFLIDALRYQNLIPDDCPDAIDLFINQVRVDKKLSEGTEVIIIPIPDITPAEATARYVQAHDEVLRESTK